MTLSSPTSASTDAWEAAYLRFETPEEEVTKFIGRLKRLGAAGWPRDARIVELFCGRGNGLHALGRLGFANLEGIDLSAHLVSQYRGDATMRVGDCRALPFEASSKDVLIVQGGLHHLPDLPADLDQTLAEARRVLRPGGTFVAVEPWLTPFLRFVHCVTERQLARTMNRKIEALHTMIVHERATYENWLHRPAEILAVFDRHFTALRRHIGWGKLMFVGTPR